MKVKDILKYFEKINDEAESPISEITTEGVLTAIIIGVNFDVGIDKR